MTDEKENEEKTENVSKSEGIAIGYGVEVRSTGGKPFSLGNFVVGAEWQALEFKQAKPGEPTHFDGGRPYALHDVGLRGWNAANYLLWHLRCDADHRQIHNVESRIVTYSVTYHTTATRLDDTPLGFENRNEMTDDEKSAK